MTSRNAIIAAGALVLLTGISLPASAQSPEPAYVGFENPRGGFADLNFLFMTRNTSGPFLFYDDGSSLGILAANDLEWSWGPGVQARVGGTIGGGNLGVMVGGFWMSPFRASFDGSFSELTLAYREDGGFLVSVNGVDGLEAIGLTSIHGAEANLFFQVSPDVAVYAGAAYVGLGDTLEVLIQTAGGDITSDWYANNRMIGPQIGGRVSLGGTEPGNVFLTTDIRGGILFNAASLELVDTGFAGSSLFEGRSNVLMLGAQISAGFQITRGLAFSVGYQVLWLNNVTLADEIFTLGADDAFLMHGAQMGLTLGY